MTVSRRHFLGDGLRHCLGGLAPAALVPLLTRCGDSDQTLLIPVPGAPFEVEPWPLAASSELPFAHGVASGDPLSDAVVLWTRVTPPAGMVLDADVGAGTGADIEVEWRLGLDRSLLEVIQEGSLRAQAEHDYTVHVDVSGLVAGTTYYYQFRALGRTSLRGRTKTLPSGSAARMRLAVTSCANYPAGFFNAYAELARTDLDLVLHLGDYLYEYGNGSLGDGLPLGRLPEPSGEIVSLDDYRRRHAQYKTDSDLQELHRQHPWVAVWDDHEVADNSFRLGAYNHQDATEGDYEARKRAATRAYREWMPLRSSSDDAPIYRSFACGDLLDLLMLDTRLVGRDEQASDCDLTRIDDPARQLLGREQESWLLTELAASQARGTRWRLIGQQVIFAPLSRSMRGCVTSTDDWDGYEASRRRVLDALERESIDNVVILTGDAHSSWATDVARDPFDPAAYDPATGRGSQLVELVTPAISSPPAGAPSSSILATHPHVKFSNQTSNGYVLLDVSPDRVQAEWYFVDTVRERSSRADLGGVFQTLAGAAHIISAEGRSEPRSDAPLPA
jgi:alkaline phosphatase D